MIVIFAIIVNNFFFMNRLCNVVHIKADELLSTDNQKWKCHRQRASGNDKMIFPFWMYQQQQQKPRKELKWHKEIVVIVKFSETANILSQVRVNNSWLNRAMSIQKVLLPPNQHREKRQLQN